MRSCLLAVALVVMPAACQRSDAPPPAPAGTAARQATDDARFAQLSQRALAAWLELSPIWATQVGEHRYDGEIDDLGTEGRRRRLDTDRRLLADLDALDVSRLSRENQVDAAILRNRLEYGIWGEEILQEWAWDPQLYHHLVGGAVYRVMAREFAPLPERLRSATARMEKLPRLLAQARENLDPARVPKAHAETVVQQNRGLLRLVDEFVVPHAGVLEGEERRRLESALETFREAVAVHQDWLEDTLLPNAAGDFRLGAERYDRKLRYALNTSLSRQEIGRRAEAEVERVRHAMYGIARTVLDGRPDAPPLPDEPDDDQRQAAIEAALELAYAERPEREEIVDFARHTLQVAIDFTRDRNLVTVPDDPVKIIVMPEFQRGVAVAYADSPGPLDRGLDTYYAISPIPEHWTDAQVESFLREYNDRMIHVLSIHEGVPGHYLEGAHSAAHPSTLRAVLRSYTFAEGWAVYAERVMSDAGYLDGDPLFRLVQLKYYLRAVSNALLDQGVHVDGWDRDRAMELMVRTTFQQESEAALKWLRAHLYSTQLTTYFVGAQEHFDMRAAVEAARGDDFDLKAYHDEVLSHGSPPVRFARQLILDEPIQ